ncbi:MAG: cadherin domain-containing protein, partial [Bacteroidota bacterium]
IDEQSGNLSIADSSQLNFEINPTFGLTIETSDGELTDDISIDLILRDINEAPIVNDSTIVIAENTGVNSPIGFARATDEDGDQVDYFIASGNESQAFAINQTTGEITIADEQPIDFETNPRFDLEVRAFDHQLVGSGLITVLLVYAEADPIVKNDTFQIDENSENNTRVGKVEAADPNGDVVSFSIDSGNDELAFYIDSSTGELFVNNSSLLDYETKEVFELGVGASDNKLNKGTGIIRIELMDVEDDPLSAPDGNGGVAKVYPNPTVKLLYVEWSEYDHATITNTLGATLFTSNQTTIDVRNLSPGNYIIVLHAKNDALNVTFKFVKK